MKNIDSDLIRGNIDTIILTTMLDGDKYGLDIIKEVETRSNGTYELKQPTLYSCLKRLENQELISSYWLDSDIGGRRHYYKLTEKGKDSLLQKQEEWAKSKFIIDNLLSNHDYDEYRLVKKEDYDKIIEGKQFEYNKEASLSVNEDSVIDETESDELIEDSSDESPANVYYDDANDFEDAEEIDLDDDSDENNSLETFEERPRIDYHDDNDDAEADYPNQKRFKIPSIYDSIKIDEDDIVAENELDETLSIYSSLENDEENEDNELETLDLDELESDDSSDNDDTFDSTQIDEFILGHEYDNDENDEDDDDRVYVSSYQTEEPEEDDNSDLDIPTNTRLDQSQNELNILSRLRMQEDEEINEYHGDKNSYINHLNQHDDIETLKSDDLNVVQQDLLSVENYLSQSSIDNKINEFSSAIDELNRFNSEVDDNIEDIEEDVEMVNSPAEFDDSTTLEDELITNVNSQEELKDIIEFKPKTINDDDYLSELEELKQHENHGFFNSLDSAEYSQNKIEREYATTTFDSLDDYLDTDSSDASFEKQFENYNNQFGYNQSEPVVEETEDYSSETTTTFDDTEENYSLSSFDDIISKNVDSYTNDTTKFMSSNEFQTFTPRFTENDYKQKLNNLSAYSKVNTEEPVTQNVTPPEDVMSKVKDIQTLRSEFEDEGICVKEFKKSNGHDDVDRTYLLINKINLIKSLILLFGYVFLLSAVYIIMNNTSAQTIYNFSFKYFLYGFIPFGIYALIYAVLFILNPYRKIPAKFAPRIMIFISIIITIQLLLITYCVNLQLGFYSFTQSHYNHLIWVIPTIISFAPIVSNLIYMALYYSKNFNV